LYEHETWSYGTQIEGVWEQGAEEKIWTYKKGGNRRKEKII